MEDVQVVIIRGTLGFRLLITLAVEIARPGKITWSRLQEDRELLATPYQPEIGVAPA